MPPRFTSFMFAIAGFAFASSALASPQFEGELIFPPQDKHTHGSSIVEHPNGDLLVCWYHGSGERTADDVKVLGARRKAGAREWSAPFMMADTPSLPDCNPVLFADPRGVLWLFWVTIQNNQWGGALLKYRTATHWDADGEPKWDWQDVIHTQPQRLDELFPPLIENVQKALPILFAGNARLAEEVEQAKLAAHDKLKSRLGWMTRIHPIMVSGNRMVLGLYSDVFNCSLAAYTEDWGKTWACGEPILDPEPKYISNVQPSFVMKKNGDIVAYMRDNGIPKYVRTATSKDGGKTWSRLGMLKIRESGASVEAIALKSGRWLLVSNDLVDGRHRLSAHISDDEGETWKWGRAIEEAETGQGSFSYPSVIQAKDGVIHATFSYERHGESGQTIKHTQFNEEWAVEREAKNP